MNTLPGSIAIAGGWGYIGQQFLHAALRLGLKVYVHDPGPPPESVAALPIEIVSDEAAFYQLPADLFYLALHPAHREPALEALFKRAAAGERILVLNEKPMAAPEEPERCRILAEQYQSPQLIMLYDFIELFDPMTERINAFLAQFNEVTLGECWMYRSKDREDPANPRNYKIMVPIQYQETVHCVAFLLSLLGNIRGGLDAALADGLSVQGVSQPYAPPNPEAYPEAVDGKLDGTLTIGDCVTRLHTDFKAGASFTKRRVLKGAGDGKPFEIEADRTEGRVIHTFLKE